MKGLSRDEQETVIRWDAAEGLAYIDTAHPATIRKLDKLSKAHPNVYKLVRDDAEYGARRYTAPASLIRFGKPASEVRRQSGKRLAENAYAQDRACAEKP